MREIFEIAHDMAQDLFRVGAIDEITKQEIETMCAFIGSVVQCDACKSSAGSSERETSHSSEQIQ